MLSIILASVSLKCFYKPLYFPHSLSLSIFCICCFSIFPLSKVLILLFFPYGSVVSQPPGGVCSVRGLSDGPLWRMLKDHNMAVGLPAHFKGNKTFPFKGLLSVENNPPSLEPPLASYTLKAFCWAKKKKERIEKSGGKEKHDVKTSDVKGSSLHKTAHQRDWNKFRGYLQTLLHIYTASHYFRI